MYDEIFHGVTGRSHESIEAVAIAWRRHGLLNRSYPGALPCHDTDARLAGILWLNVNSAAVAALDRFEGNEYQRVSVVVQSSSGQSYQAQIYQWLMPQEIQGDWDPQTFEQQHRADFLDIHGSSQD